ncbi:uncharacterized protein LOC118181767 [Stegodyphus dumicola]|uniref:uncharacterized protein LOC118181767 n=1 Tax=Stegodyphus dumicola TaxID=202533 RepID=UPI0015AFABE0|nr:uncharacterized protein LOC118181767 [Stegodyphus dumicola]XP_035206849.1 uncharacterized protein LOC118181767 [Stegodyphus dumicola]XP_035206850.1 uncharacterized protein LOC118181767 [Stegodyphus dumicola]
MEYSLNGTIESGMQGLMHYIKSAIEQGIDVKNYILNKYPSLEEGSFEEETYDFLKAPALDNKKVPENLEDLWKLLKVYNMAFGEMKKAANEDEEEEYHSHLSYMFVNNSTILEHLYQYLGREVLPPDDIPEEFWEFEKSDSVVRDLIILKRYIDFLSLILNTLKEIKPVELSYLEDFILSTGI